MTISPQDKRYLDEYFAMTGDVWQQYFDDRKTMRFQGMSMKERDDILNDLRKDLDEILKEQQVKPPEKKVPKVEGSVIDLEHAREVYDEIRSKLTGKQSSVSTACLLTMVEDIVKPTVRYAKTREGLVKAAKELKELCK